VGYKRKFLQKQSSGGGELLNYPFSRVGAGGEDWGQSVRKEFDSDRPEAAASLCKKAGGAVRGENLLHPPF